MLALLALAAPAAVIASGMPALLAWPLAAAALLHGVRQLERESQRPAQVVEVHGAHGRTDTATSIDGTPAAEARLQWRGPLAFLSWRTVAGRRAHLAWWPDTLPSPQRRELRLAAPGPRPTGKPASMAP